MTSESNLESSVATYVFDQKRDLLKPKIWKDENLHPISGTNDLSKTGISTVICENIEIKKKKINNSQNQEPEDRLKIIKIMYTTLCCVKNGYLELFKLAENSSLEENTIYSLNLPSTSIPYSVG